MDLDGCLIDSKAGILESFCVSVRETLPGVTADPAQVRVGPPIKEMYRRTFPGLTEEKVALLAQAYRAHYDTIGWRRTTLYPGGMELLRRCAELGIVVDIATNKPRRAATTILTHLEVGPLLRSVTTVDSAEPPFAGKGALLEHVCQINRIDRATALYTGDTEEDLLAARGCGLEFALAGYGYGDATHPRTVAGLAELQALVEAW